MLEGGWASPPSSDERGRHTGMGERMKALLRGLLREDRGQDLAEYAIALAVVAVGIGLIAVAIGTDVNQIWSHAEPPLQTVINAE